MSSTSHRSAPSRKNVHFGIEDRDSDSDASLNELLDSADTKQEDPDYYDPIYFDSDEDDDDDDDDNNNNGTVRAGETSAHATAHKAQDDDEIEYDARVGIPTIHSKEKKKTITATSVKEITKGLEESKLDLGSSSKIVSKAKAKKRPALSDLDLLYDPDQDDRDQDWLVKKIAANRPKDCNPEDIWTDAILSCPMCLTHLCFDCQQHEFYSHQFRAMFVESCRTIENEVLRFPKEAKKSNRNAKNKSIGSGSGSGPDSGTGADDGQRFIPDMDEDEDMAYHPVVCEICNTKVALVDQDEVYHFFNVIPTPV
ncbi:hypothetical protein BGZ99_008862 [Dissophora globulifera]|uniref:E2F-associated phosphoprotein n=1 Tax=Dissophora globulifera TaxID=979702 RepID=A0A9P6R6D3_9FUNG|nr:hypothetical protein BGZ99_008862 [Dissophora globulifera]